MEKAGGPGLGVQSLLKASLSRDEILLGVHEPNLPSSGSGDHCRGTHEAAVAMGGPWHKRCVTRWAVPSTSEVKPRILPLLLYSQGPENPVVPGVALPCSGCIAGSRPQPLCQPLGALQRQSPLVVQGPRPTTWFNLSL